MESETQEPPPFRWNRQAVFMICLTAVMVALPFAGLLLASKGFFASAPPAPKPPAPAVDTTALQQGLEKVSEKQFQSATTLDEGNTVVLDVASADDAGPRIARIQQIAKDCGGSAVDMSGGGTRRVLANVPASRAELFRRAIRGDRVDFSAIPPGAAMEMVTIELKAP